MCPSPSSEAAGTLSGEGEKEGQGRMYLAPSPYLSPVIVILTYRLLSNRSGQKHCSALQRCVSVCHATSGPLEVVASWGQKWGFLFLEAACTAPVALFWSKEECDGCFCRYQSYGE